MNDKPTTHVTVEQKTPKWTHKGWMLFCPVYFVDPYTSDAPVVAARWLVLEPLLSLAHLVQTLIIGLCSMCIEDYEPHFYFKVTGEIR